MKRMLALLLTVAMLLGACAFAEEAAFVAHSHRLSNVCLFSGGQVIDLSGLSLELDVTGADGAESGRVHLDSADGTVAELGLAAVDGDYIVHLASDTLGHVDYAVDPVALIAQVLDRGVDGLVNLLQSLDTTELAQNLVDIFANAGSTDEVVDAPETVEAAPEQTLTLPEITFEGDPASLLQGCLSAPETVEMGGVEYAPGGAEIVIADGSYTSQEMRIDTETLCALLNMICLDGEPSGWGDMVRDTGVRFEAVFSFQTGEAEGLNQIVDATVNLDDGAAVRTMNMSLNTFYGEGGERTTAVSYALTSGEEGVGLSFFLTRGQHAGEAFAHGAAEMEGATVLTDMELEEAIDTLGQSLFAVGQDALGALIAPVMESLMANVDMGELELQTGEAGAVPVE